MNKYNTKRDGVRLIIEETREEFNSIQACADYLGVGASWLSRVVNGDRGLCTIHGYHIRRIDDEHYVRRRRGRSGVKIRIVETGEEFESISECARHIQGSAGTIHDILHNNRGRITHRGYHFEFVY